jgi:eukaryotic-like serine/threonine-protein kinase
MGNSKAMATPANPPPRAGMTTERWQQIKAALSAALDSDSDRVSSCLDRVCAGDADLRREVENLLALKDDPGLALLESAPVLLALDQADCTKSLWVGRRVGPYEIVEEIGSGGMGEVYRAIRADDAYRKEVAIKLLRFDFNSSAVVARFKSERQVLAGLEHPNIARLLDGGSTDEGIPYFAMELIEGEPLYKYCDSHKLDTSDRLRLFLPICSAAQYAHQRLIVHRDLKPANILVTADGTPKLLDFGIAKILDAAPLSDESTVTLFRFLTPEYASPEQVRGEAVTTASDVYSLGLLLYEMLTGHRPYRATGDAPHEIARAICETSPEKPSTIVLRTGQGAKNGSGSDVTPAAVSALREGTPEKLSRRLRGDLDNIVLTALRKEPERRYASVEQMATDIRRHLDRLPVSAVRDTLFYRASKFIARNKSGVAAAAFIVVALLTGAAVSLYEAYRARQNELRAERRFNDVRALANSLLFEIHDAIRDLPGSTPARKLIVERALKYLDSLDSEAGGDPALERELATAYERVGEVQGEYLSSSLGDTESALRSFEKALASRQSLAASKSASWEDRLALAKCHRLVAGQMRATGNTKDAFQHIQAAVSLAENQRAARPEDKQILAELGFDYEIRGMIQERSASQATGLGDSAGALESDRKAIEIDKELLRLDPGDDKSLHALAVDEIHYAHVLDMGDPAKRQEALQYFQHSLEIAKQLNARSPSVDRGRSVANAYNYLGMWYDAGGDHARSLENHREAMRVDSDLLAKDPQNAMLMQALAIDCANTGEELGVQGRKSESEALLDKSVALFQSLVRASPQNTSQLGFLGSAHGMRADNYLVLKDSRAALGDFAAAMGIYRQLLAKNPENMTAASRLFTARVSAARLEMQLGIANAAGDLKRALSDATPLLSAAGASDGALYAAAVAYSLIGQTEAGAAQSADATAKKSHWEAALQSYEQSSSMLTRLKKPANETALIEFGPVDAAHLSRQITLCKSSLGQLAH